MNCQFTTLCRFLFFLVLFCHRTDGYIEETDYVEPESSNYLVVNQTTKNKVEFLGSVLRKQIHLLKDKSDTKIDLVFLIDSSASVGRLDFLNELKFVRQLLSDFTVDNNHTKVSVITFSSKNSVLRQIDYITPQREEKHKCTLIDNDLPQIKYKGGGTYTLGAFKEAKKVLQSARAEASKAIFLITDGFSNGGDPRPAARGIRESGVKIFTVGIARGNKEELWDMSSEPKNETSYILDSFEEFESLARRALHEDLGRGDFIWQPEDKCGGLCFERIDCCDEKASCKCGTYTGTYECICGPGYYGTGLQGSCKPCPPGTYKAIPSPGDVNTCTRCPDENHITSKGSIDLAQCVCKKGFRDFNNTRCVAMRCPVLTAPKNGYFVNDKCDDVFNAACGIRCKPGYYLKGSSLRICQEGGSWNGKPTECIMKTCPALPRPKNGNMICDKDGFPFSTVCRFTCDTGYKLVGSRKRECLAIAAWTGINTRCREITCRPLPFVKDGKIYPSTCTKDDVPFGTTCQISCYHGYSVVGPSIKQCTPDGMWAPSADGEMTHCDDTSPPIMKCPFDVEIEADADDSSAEVVWQPPVALDNSGIRPIVTVFPAIEPPKRFPIGFTKVKYAAEDLSGNKVKCTFTVHVKDITPPFADRCVSPFPFITSEQYANVTWAEPSFSDNSGTISRVDRNLAPGLFPQGKTDVIYTAYDESGNNNTCVITVNVLPHPCQYPPPPVNGERKCFETDEGVHCKVYCLEGFAFAIPPADDYFCAYDHIWRPEDKFPIPDCSVQTGTNSVTQPASVTYLGTVPCRKQVLNVNEIEQVFMEKVTEKVASICGDNFVCEVDNIQTTCEEDKDFNRIKLIFPNRSKRRTEDRQRIRRAPERNKMFTITFDVIVKGEKKKKGKDPKSVQRQLESSIESIMGTVKEEADKGSLDLKMDGKLMMQFANISYIADDHKFECEPGSIIVNTSCIKCPVGTMYSAVHKECRSCPQGFYQPEEGHTTCLVCPNNTSTPKNNSKSINDCKALCLPGTFSDDGLEQCTTCPESTYQNAYGQVSCLPCPNDTTTHRRGVRRRTMCRAECSPGYASITGLEPCLPCPKGTYQSDSGKSFCLECPGGGKTTNIGSADIIDCDVRGDYQSDIAEEVGFNECFGNQCLNGATCQSRGGFGFDCICAPGFTGVYCDKEVDECETEPCLNGGTCVDLNIDFSCKCAEGFTGRKCEVDINDCEAQPCMNNGTCVDGINAFNCSCPSAFEGERCERLKDDCAAMLCQHNGTCVNTLQGHDCQCVNGYSGVECEINDDECASGPCVNNAKCIDGIADYSCLCVEGFTGKQCETEIDECLSSPCSVGSTCVNELNSFRCVCKKTFSGRLCETELNGDYMLDFPTGGTVNYASFSMNTDLTSFTLAFWIKTSDESNQGTPFSYSVGALDNALTITNYDGFVIYVNNKKMNTDIKANDGTWNHILVEWSSNRGAWKIYKNAFLWDQGYNLAAGETIRGGGTVVIGQEQDIGGAFSQPESFVGKLTQLHLWSEELTFSQIEKMIVTCDKFIGDVIAWPDVQSGLQGDLQASPSGFCKDCPIPLKPLYTNIDYSGTKGNDIVSYSCLTGYNLVGQAKRRCLVTSEWESVDPQCLRVDCGFPGAIPNGAIIGSSFSYDNRVRYNCNNGYKLVGNVTRYCNEKGVWEGQSPVCEAIKCVLPILSENTRVSNSKQSFRPGEDATFSCTSGSKLYTEHDSVTCQMDGTWDKSVPTCDAQTCKSPPLIQNGAMDVIQEDYSVGFIIQFSCSYGYKLSENSLNPTGKISCLPSGEWESNLPQCVIITCQTPPNVPNSQRTYLKLEFLSTVEYKCNKGYNIYGDNILECLENGFWDHAPPSCDPVDCGSAESTTHGIVSADSTTFGSTITYICNPGYYPNAVSTRTCLENSTWSGITPQCLPVSCGQPDNINHGSYVGNRFTFMDSVTYKCNPGYILVGESTRRCTAAGTWTTSIPSCTKIECGAPPTIDNGYYTPSGLYYGDIVQYQCEEGYNIKGNTSIRCQSSGRWSLLLAKCEPVFCPVLTVPQGTVIKTTGQIFRSVAIYTCTNGYIMSGENIRICQPEGFWSSTAPTCEPIMCSVLDTPNHGKIYASSLRFRSVANYSCDEGYVLNGENLRECQSNGSWSGSSPKCEPVLCPVISAIRSGNVVTSGQTTGSRATYSCNLGFTLDGENVRICLPDGHWSGDAPSCNPVLCPVLSAIINGNVLTTGQTTGSRATHSCNLGFTLEGENVRICQPDGHWSGEAPLCNPVICPAITTIDSGTVNTTGQTTGSQATYSCNLGFTLEGENVRICQPDGHWSGNAPSCNPVLCPVLSAIINGYVLTTGQTTGSRATYSCNLGFTLEGENVRICQPDGHWSGEAPLCNPVLCPAITTLDGGTVNTTGQTTGRQATYSCNLGFTLEGENVRICQPDGHWSGTAPFCNPVLCPILDAIDGGSINTTGHTVSSRATYVCNQGFVMDGENIRICQPEGHWSGNAPLCNRVLCPVLTSVEGGTVNTTDQTIGSRATYYCNHGFAMDGENIRICQPEGHWSGNAPSCKEVLCPVIPSINGGSIVTSGQTTGSRSTYSCNQGFTLKGENVRICQPDGHWSGEAPSCNPVLCPVITTIDGGSIITTGLTTGSQAKYSCYQGFTINGENIRICQPDGHWSGTAPFCNPVLCPILDAIDGGSINTTGHTVSSQATYVCNQGFVMDGENIRICQPEGHWSGNAPLCNRVLCPVLTSVEGGTVNTTGQTIGSQATYYCNQGLAMDGENIRICQPEGHWSGNAPSCKEVLCPVLISIDNGSIITTGLTTGSRATYSCNQGFKLEGENVRICLPEGHWSGNAPSCKEVLCPVIPAINGGSIVTTGLTTGSRATYSCNQGFKLEGENVRICQPERHWSGDAPSCNPVLCPAITTIDGGSIITTGLTTGSQATYSCNHGFTINGENIRICQPDGHWSGTAPFCNPVLCPILDAIDGGSINTTGHTVISRATYVCNQGFVMDGENIRICQPEGHWSGNAPLCNRVLCPVLTSVEGGTVNTTGQTIGSQATYYCNQGLAMDGENIRICQPEGHWSGNAPSCKEVLCPVLISIDNGSIITTGLTTGSRATYSCNQGFTMEGEHTRKCQTNGRWSGVSPLCSPVQCPVLGDLEGGIIISTGQIYQSVAIYSCTNGYILEGQSNRTCQSDGQWSDNAPNCNPVLCPVLITPDGGNVSTSGQRVRAIATYSCNEGYTMEGENIRICQPEGYWSNNAPKCLPTTCSQPLSVKNGAVANKDLHIDSVAIYSCDPGFNLVGDDVRRCLGDLTWSGSEPICVPIRCRQPPEIENGKQSTTGLSVSSVASFECDRGFELKGADELICTNTGDWSAQFPLCALIECETPSPVISNGRMFGNTFAFNSTISYECDNGYMLIGSHTRTCLHSGDWNNPIPTCEIVRCSPPRLINGLTSSFNTEFNTRITFSCKRGYVLFGPRERLCLSNSLWSGTDPVCVKCTEPPTLEHGFVRISEEIATYTCDIGYYLVGNDKLECQMDGSWVNDLPVCLAVECENLENESFINGNMSMNGYTFGQETIYECNEGYKLIGSPRRQCQADGSWSGISPVCLIVRCPGTFELLNGRIEGDNLYRSELTFTCSRGYTLIGNSTLTCLSTGSWSGTAPFCDPIKCEQPSKIAHGSVSFNSLTMGSKVAYSCDHTYELIGDPIRECLYNARWSGTQPVCSQLECPPPNQVLNAQIVVRSRAVGQIIRYQCNEGFTLNGLSFRLCLLQRQWSGVDPTCQPVVCPTPSQLDHGTILNVTNEYTFGNTIQYQCDEGYKLVGEVERTCTAHGSQGRWSSIAPTCTIVSCGPPKEINNAIISIVNDNSFSFGSTLSIECENGYTSLSGKSVTSKCKSNGEWSVTFLECVKAQCPPIGTLLNGNIGATGFSYNDILTFSCKTGYTLIGASSITCLSSSRWTAELPICILVYCPRPEQLANGLQKGNNFTFGNNITYECNTGYRLTGDSSRTCTDQGKWSGREPLCLLIVCQVPKQITHGHWNTTEVSLPFDTVIGFTCDIGYVRSNGDTLLCSESGVWIGDSAECSIITCPIPPKILNGRVSYTVLTFNSEVEYICENGYDLQGGSKHRCLETGTWDKNAPTCAPVNCGEPEFVPFADTIGEINTYGNTVTHICHPGYVIVGKSVRTCTSNGRWSGYPPVCQPITCVVPPAVDNAIRNGTNFTYQSSITYQCKKGFKVVGTASLSCGVNGHWKGDVPSCQIVTCGQPPVVHFSTTTLTGFTYGSTVSYVCNKGYNLYGDPVAMCEHNGNWSSVGNTRCEPNDCGLPVQILNGKVLYNLTTYQSSAIYICEPLFELRGAATITCGSNGLWEGIVPSCEHASCGPPVVSRNVRVVGGNYAVGNTVTYVCPKGHIIVGNVKSKCLESGYWSGATPQCLTVSCGSITSSDKALKVIGLQNITYQYEDMIQFECNDGYVLQGETQMRCLSNGTWSSEIPTCQPIPERNILVCSSSQIIPNSNPITTVSGSTTNVTCVNGYQAVGNMSAVCLTDQSWTPPTGHCLRVSCGKPRIKDMVNVVRIHGSSYFYNDQIRFQCRPGVLPVKIPPVITCQQSGLWDGEISCSLPCKGGCSNGGICMGLYGCKCPSGFGGTRCERAYCILPCLNGGTCISPYLCSCLPGYQGTRCESPVCDRPCQFGGICIKPNMCHCKHGFRKPFCDHPNAFPLPTPPLPVTLRPPTSTSEVSHIIGGSFLTNQHSSHINNAHLASIPTRPTTIRELLIPGIRLPIVPTTQPRPVTTSFSTMSTTTYRPQYLDYEDYDFKIPNPRK